ncbi:MAG: Hpt domain-containing protein [Cyanobacteria bacterium]|nr:Hpt domain-containing protein [Cyanobacteriota bacterium]
MHANALPPAIDVTVIEMLRSLAEEGQPDPVAEVTTTFITDGRERLSRMSDALLNGDEVSARRAAHSLRGMSGAIGALHLCSLSRDVEVAEPGAIDRARIQRLEQEFQRVSAALQAA